MSLDIYLMRVFVAYHLYPPESIQFDNVSEVFWAQTSRFMVDHYSIFCDTESGSHNSCLPLLENRTIQASKISPLPYPSLITNSLNYSLYLSVPTILIPSMQL